MKNTFAVSALLLSAALVGCATDDGDSMSTTEIQSSPVTGMVGGKAWTFQAGHTDAFLSEGDDDFFATLFPATFTACGFSEPAGDHLIIAVPKTVGDYPMSLARNMTFVVGSDNKIAIDGHIEVTEVTATKLKGGIAAKFDAQNSINGTFELTICAD